MGCGQVGMVALVGYEGLDVGRGLFIRVMNPDRVAEGEANPCSRFWHFVRFSAIAFCPHFAALSWPPSVRASRSESVGEPASVRESVGGGLESEALLLCSLSQRAKLPSSALSFSLSLSAKLSSARKANRKLTPARSEAQAPRGSSPAGKRFSAQVHFSLSLSQRSRSPRLGLLSPWRFSAERGPRRKRREASQRKFTLNTHPH